MTGMADREGAALGCDPGIDPSVMSLEYRTQALATVAIGSDHLRASASSSYLLIVPDIRDIAASEQQVKFSGIE
jgi:hypothetical protein